MGSSWKGPMRSRSMARVKSMCFKLVLHTNIVWDRMFPCCQNSKHVKCRLEIAESLAKFVHSLHCEWQWPYLVQRRWWCRRCQKKAKLTQRLSREWSALWEVNPGASLNCPDYSKRILWLSHWRSLKERPFTKAPQKVWKNTISMNPLQLCPMDPGWSRYSL